LAQGGSGGRRPDCSAATAGEALGEAAAALVRGHPHGLLACGAEALAAGSAEQLLDAVRGLADGAGGLAGRAGEGERGDVAALHLRVPAVGANLQAGDRFEIEQGAEGGEGILIRSAALPAAVADDDDGCLVLHDSHEEP
jgi:hypothetical protein